MTNHYVMPPEQPQEPVDTLTPLAAIAGVLIAAMLLTSLALLSYSGITLPTWAGFGFGSLFGLSATVSAGLLYRSLG